MFVGRLNKVKGIDYLLRRWNMVENKNRAKLHLVGNGNYWYEGKTIKEEWMVELLCKSLEDERHQ